MVFAIFTHWKLDRQAASECPQESDHRSGKQHKGGKGREQALLEAEPPHE